MELLTVEEAYKSMFYYLECLYSMTDSDDLGGFLGGMSLLEDKRTADPAVWEDWISAVNKVKQERNFEEKSKSSE